MKKSKNNIFSIVLMIILIIYSLSLIVLFGWSLLSSFKVPIGDYDENILGFPKQWTFSNYGIVLKHFSITIAIPGKGTNKIGILGMLVNTLTVCFFSGFCATFFPCLMGYLVAKYKYFLSKIVYTVTLIVMALPIIGADVSTLYLLRKIGIYDTYLTIIFQRSSFIGLYFFVFEATFSGISDDFYEAASLDGASEVLIFFRIMLPMVKNTFVTVFILIFVNAWNDYQYPLLYLPSFPNLAYGLNNIYNGAATELSYVPILIAGSTLLVFPILILFILLKDKLMGNVSMGGLKE